MKNTAKSFTKFHRPHKILSLAGKIALSLIITLALFAIVAPLILPYHPNDINVDSKFLPPSFSHLLGTDYLGRDVFTRLVYGARISFFSTFITLALIIFFGLVIGAVSGFLGGRVDMVLMRVCDVFLSFPTIILSLFLVALLGVGVANVILAIALTHFAWYARIIRSLIFSLKNKEYVILSSCYGLTSLQSFRRNMLPPILTQCMVLASMDIGHIMLHIAGLSFLGLGVVPPTAEWGVMMSDCKEYVWSHPLLILYPGAALFVCVAMFNILSDSLRDYFDIDLRDLR